MEPQAFLGERVTLHAGDCLDVIRGFADSTFDSVVTDPPYALVSIVKRFGKSGAKPTRDGDVYARASAGFMGKAWDTGERAFAVEFWEQVLRVLKPGGHVVAFAGTRTYHRLAMAIEDAGFEIRDQIGWLYGSGFPKSHDVSKAIDKAAGAERDRMAPQRRLSPSNAVHASGFGSPEWAPPSRQPITEAAAAWQGWGTALKPAWEPIVFARKPLAGTVAENVLEHGTGALNIDGCRVDGGKAVPASPRRAAQGAAYGDLSKDPGTGGGWDPTLGRWPANVVHDGSDEAIAAFPSEAGGSGKASGPSLREGNTSVARGKFNGLADGVEPAFYGDSGTAARFFYSAKADAHDRVGSKHPTVKPVDLMQWLVRLVTPKGGLVLDPFAGTGTTGEAAWREGMRAVLVEREEEYRADVARRLRLADSPSARAAAVAAARPKPAASAPSLFDALEAPPLAPALDVNDQP